MFKVSSHSEATKVIVRKHESNFLYVQPSTAPQKKGWALLHAHRPTQPVSPLLSTATEISSVLSSELPFSFICTLNIHPSRFCLNIACLPDNFSFPIMLISPPFVSPVYNLAYIPFVSPVYNLVYIPRDVVNDLFACLCHYIAILANRSLVFANVYL